VYMKCNASFCQVVVVVCVLQKKKVAKHAQKRSKKTTRRRISFLFKIKSIKTDRYI